MYKLIIYEQEGNKEFPLKLGENLVFFSSWYGKIKLGWL